MRLSQAYSDHSSELLIIVDYIMADDGGSL